MAHSFSRILVHVTFSTKHRAALLPDDMREELHAYVIGIFRNYDSPSIRTNSVIDHIHSVFRQSPKYAFQDIVEEVKRGTTKWIRQRWPVLADFSWQIGYWAFSVG